MPDPQFFTVRAILMGAHVMKFFSWLLVVVSAIEKVYLTRETLVLDITTPGINAFKKSTPFLDTLDRVRRHCCASGGSPGVCTQTLTFVFPANTFSITT